MNRTSARAPRVSVIIPTYNHRDYVLQTLDSVFAQTFTDYEIIVINDGSPDDSAEVLRPLANAGKIRYFEQPNAGQSAARNRGLAQATGEFIAFLDDDDLWPPDKLRWQVEFLQDHADAVMVGGALQQIGADGEALGKTFYPAKSVTFETLFRGNPFFSPGQVLIRAVAMKQVGGLDEKLWGTDDYDLWFRLSEIGALGVSHRLALEYRLHAANASRNQSKMLRNALRTLKTHLARAPRARRAWFARRFYRWVYGWIPNPISTVRVHKLAAFPAVLRDLSYFFYMAAPIARDRVLLRRFLYLLTPRFLHRALDWLSRKMRL